MKAITGLDQLVVVVGPAGTGKTTTTARAVGALTAQRRPVVGLAPSGKAADVLATEAGCPTDTLAGFLTRHRGGTTPWPAGTTVVLDEAGMAATDDLARLVDLVRRNNWRLVAVGDPAQLAAVGRGGVFAHWCDTVPHIELETPRRFRQPWEADASLLLRAGDPSAAEQYAEHGRLRTAHPALLALDVARTHQRHTDAGRTVAITTNTAEMARTINLAIQRPRGSNPGARARRRHHRTGRRPDRHPPQRPDAPHRPRREGPQPPHLDRHRRRRRTDRSPSPTPTEATSTLPGRYVAEHVELGWAVTGYGNQGDTVDVGIAVLEPGTTRNHAYVAMTRGRDTNLAVIPDATGTLDPADALTDMIGARPRHESALSVRSRLHREAGVPEPPVPTTDAAGTDQAAQVRAIQQRLDALQARSPGRSLGI